MRHDGKRWYRQDETGQWVKVDITPWEKTGPWGKAAIWLIVVSAVGVLVALIW